MSFKKNIKNILILYFPWLICCVVGLKLIPETKQYLKEIIDLWLVTFIFIWIIIIISKTKRTRFIISFFYLFLSFIVFFKLSFYHLFKVKPSASALFVIFETNTAEMSEFFKMYANHFTVFLVVLLLTPLFFIRYKNFTFSNLPKNRWLIPMGFFTILLSFLIIYKKFKLENFFLLVSQSYKDYSITKQMLKKNLAKPESKYLKHVSGDSISQTYIVIIGESTSRKHMQLYGYHRETNPLLNEVKKNLMVFDSVISPEVHTILALDKILTFSNYKQPYKRENASIVQLANMAGFSTFWISNQRPVGLHESVSTQMAYASSNRFFLTTDDYMDTNYDEKVLPVLDSVLKMPDKKKMIFIHLIGTHGKYSKRFPPEKKFFNDKNVNSYVKTPETIQEVNDYDNAVRYNDWIVRSIIDKVKEKNILSAVCYFSDHGDEVYDTIDYRGHNSYFATPSMHEVPLIFWFSTSYKKKYPYLFTQNKISKRKYNLEDFIHTFADFSQIDFYKKDSTRSVLSKYFIKRPRIIKKNIDYDKQK